MSGGCYKYKRLPMGIKQSSDIAQEVMENLFLDLDDVEVYICVEKEDEKHSISSI